LNHGHHQFSFVILSILVAVLGSWTALDLQRQVRAHAGRIRLYWLAATAFAMGLSIFSMHFIAMLGFDIGMPVRYDLALTFASLVLAIAATFLAFIAVQAREPSAARIGTAGIAMGTGIGVMHYIGMAAMRAPASLSYDPWLVAASFGIAIVVSWVALVAALTRPRLELRLIGAVVLGLAIASMHYTAMAAVSFTPTQEAMVGRGGLDQMSLALWVGMGTAALLFFAMVSAMFDRRFEALALREARGVAAREAHLRELLTRIPLAVMVVRKGAWQGLSFANNLANDLLEERHPADLPLADMEGRTLPPSEHPFARALDEGRELTGHLVGLKRPDGAIAYLELSAAPLPAIAPGELEEMILTAHDVTARIEAEQILQQTQKLETIGHLTGGVAHDFNNLLTPIIGGLDMIRRQPGLSDRAQRVVDGALQASNKATTLVQRLLAFSRRQILQPRPIDMASILGGIRELIERSIGPTIQVEVDAEPKLVARVDPGQFELAILNLAVNARDAMPDGGRLVIEARGETVEEGAVRGLAAGRYVRISVADSGLGMDAATLKRAVEPFFSTKGAGKGTGLGLSMVHGLAAQSNGALFLSSSPGQGTRAEIWLPLDGEEIVEEEAAPAVALEPSGPATILLVDDEELVRLAVGEMLRSFGYDVIEAASGAEAMRCLEREEEIGIVVTDQVMPGMSGSALAKEIGARWAGLPVLIITGYATPEELPSHLMSLRKPFTAEQLAVRLAELLRRQEGNVVPLTRRGQ
jgi:NO-binding membrane sensor protein with MHYT domain/nitrogen-specific signal transduction histidine kinase